MDKYRFELLLYGKRGWEFGIILNLILNINNLTYGVLISLLIQLSILNLLNYYIHKFLDTNIELYKTMLYIITKNIEEED